MGWTGLRRLAVVGMLAALGGGCGHDRSVDSNEVRPPISIPLAIRGQTTVLRLSFPATDQQVEPGQFNATEICYLTVGAFRIDCDSDGSSFNLGPNDSNDLLTDNPMTGLAPAHDDKAAEQTMRLYSILFLVGGSVDRLPSALAEYIQQPGQHLNEALELAHLLLDEKRVAFAGHARGGNFVATVELTDDGRDKLIDAFDEIGEQTGSIQLVGLHSTSIRVR